MNRENAQIDQRLDSLLIAVGRLQGRTDEHTRSFARLQDDVRAVDQRVKQLADSVSSNRVRVAVLDWKLILVAATSGGLGSVLLRILGA
ncbi:MAG: hypothetical protein KKA90_05020 [Nanoarchaeota archaeon]|nr:hypothetical protein [Nanoarchaeota archaeon]